MSTTEKLAQAIAEALRATPYTERTAQVAAARAAQRARMAAQNVLGPVDVRFAAVLHGGRLVVYIADLASADTLRGLGVAVTRVRWRRAGRFGLPIIADVAVGEPGPGEDGGWFIGE